MNKMTLKELKDVMVKQNEQDDSVTVRGVIVFTEDSFGTKYTEEKSRSYMVTNHNKYFMRGMLGNSLYGDCLDGSDYGTRLDWYIPEWKVEYCYLMGYWY